MVPVEGFEPPTLDLQNRSSTPELHRHGHRISATDAGAQALCYGALRRLARASSATATSPTAMTKSAAGAASPRFSRLAFS